MQDRTGFDWTDAAANALAPDAEVARRWGRSVRTLQRWRAEGYGPVFIRIGGCIYFRVSDVLAFEERMRVIPGRRQ